MAAEIGRLNNVPLETLKEMLSVFYWEVESYG